MCSTWNKKINLDILIMKVEGMLIDLQEKSIYPARIQFKKGFIVGIEKVKSAAKNYIIPGLIDAHIHIESSMVTPGAFAGTAVRHGTVGVVSDPHEIGNILGLEGIDFMIKDAEKVPLKFWFGAPSCVPATAFESNGATISSKDISKLLKKKNIKYLSEMMNFPGVIYNDTEVLKKIDIAKRFNKPVDGHAPGLTGENLKKYISAGISTDHECSTIEEAREKISLGMKVLIREGSAARNLDSLKELIKENPEMVMLCSDDLHPDMLLYRHINKLVSKLINEGYDIFDVIKSCTVNPAIHYGLEAGWLMPGHPADFIVVDDYREMNVVETWIDGKKVFEKGRVLFNYKKSAALNKFNCSNVYSSGIEVPRIKNKVQIIEAFDGELLTKKILREAGADHLVRPDLDADVLKIVVKDRYNDAPPAVGFIKGFGLKKGAFASSVAHDSHNIICIGTNDQDIVSAINAIIKMKGGLTVSTEGRTSSLRLNIGGIMSDNSCEEVARVYDSLSNKIKSMGCKLSAPFMTLSFMALLVIPELKIGDKGLFDGNKFCLTSLFVD
jgi:adenine deaminase